MIKLSIITINYNNVNGLKKTIESVVNQSATDFEYIIIDGGSTDGSIDLIKSHENKINFWISEPDKGIYNALNKGIAKANGEYLLFLNGDDCLLHDDILNENMHHLESKDLVYFDIIYNDKNLNKRITYPDTLSFYFFYTNTICHQAIFFKKELFSKYGLYDEQLKIVADWKCIMLAVVKYGATYKHINAVFSVFDNTGISNTNDKKNEHIQLHLKERQAVLAEEFPLFVGDYEQFQLLKYYFNTYKLNYLKTILAKMKLLFFR